MTVHIMILPCHAVLTVCSLDVNDQVFDIMEYKAQLAIEAKKGDGKFDHKRLKKLSIVSLSFVKDKVEDFNTPCWVSLAVLPAIRMDNPRSKLLMFMEI